MSRRSKLIALVALIAAIPLAGCGEEESFAPTADGGPDAGGDAGQSDTDADTDTDVDTDTDTDTDIDTDPGNPGQPCWKPSFGEDHPNAGLPDCVEGYVCIGDDSGAWCTQACEVTGDLNASDAAFFDWCCAEFSDPCDPVRVWMPEALAAYCVPRTAGLGEACATEPTWPSGDERCAPWCADGELVQETVCQPSPEGAFCSLSCADVTECVSMAAEMADDLDVPLGEDFSDGCCQQWGVTDLCTPAALCN